MFTNAAPACVVPVRTEVVALGLGDGRDPEIQAIEAEVSSYVTGAVGLGLTNEEMLADVLQRYGHFFSPNADIDVVNGPDAIVVRLFVRIRTDA